MRKELEQTEEQPSWKVGLGIVGGGLMLFAFLSSGVSGAATAHAQLERKLAPVELVKMFQCHLQYDNVCATKLEDGANKWLKSQPGVRILDRHLVASTDFVILMYHYEVREWRTKQPKPPAEKP